MTFIYIWERRVGNMILSQHYPSSRRGLSCLKWDLGTRLHIPSSLAGSSFKYVIDKGKPQWCLGCLQKRFASSQVENIWIRTTHMYIQLLWYPGLHCMYTECGRRKSYLYKLRSQALIHIHFCKSTLLTGLHWCGKTESTYWMSCRHF